MEGDLWKKDTCGQTIFTNPYPHQPCHPQNDTSVFHQNIAHSRPHVETGECVRTRYIEKELCLRVIAEKFGAWLLRCFCDTTVLCGSGSLTKSCPTLCVETGTLLCRHVEHVANAASVLRDGSRDHKEYDKIFNTFVTNTYLIPK